METELDRRGVGLSASVASAAAVFLPCLPRREFVRPERGVGALFSLVFGSCSRKSPESCGIVNFISVSPCHFTSPLPGHQGPLERCPHGRNNWDGIQPQPKRSNLILRKKT